MVHYRCTLPRGCGFSLRPWHERCHATQHATRFCFPCVCVWAQVSEIEQRWTAQLAILDKRCNENESRVSNAERVVSPAAIAARALAAQTQVCVFVSVCLCQCLYVCSRLRSKTLLVKVMKWGTCMHGDSTHVATWFFVVVVVVGFSCLFYVCFGAQDAENRASAAMSAVEDKIKIIEDLRAELVQMQVGRGSWWCPAQQPHERLAAAAVSARLAFLPCESFTCRLVCHRTLSKRVSWQSKKFNSARTRWKPTTRC